MIGMNTYTYKEIRQQPDLWRKVIALMEDKKELLLHFLNEVKESGEVEVVFSGAGSSYFIGEMVAPFFQKDTGLSSKAVETTEIVTHPRLYINNNKTTLFVSFARSGNSPESVAAVNLTNKVSSRVFHIVITCNSEGALANMTGDNMLSIVLPEEANDKSLAMTSSVTSMALVALLLGRLSRLQEMRTQIQTATLLLEKKFESVIHQVAALANVEYTRGVFLGSGPMKGVAHEAHLKLQELTDGEIICKFDSFLGFRHGPKAVVNAKTMVVYFFSNNKYVRQYEVDLVRQMMNGQSAALTIGISNGEIAGINLDVNIKMGDAPLLDEAIWTITSLVTAQLLAFFKSKKMGYNPDSPSKSGAIHRVVQGVNIYDFSLNGKTNVS